MQKSGPIMIGDEAWYNKMENQPRNSNFYTTSLINITSGFSLEVLSAIYFFKIIKIGGNRHA